MPRRFDTMARPALVRIRRRKPCTRARRRLFGWKVRLPFATTLSLLHLASCSTRFPGPVGHACPHDASIGFVSRLVPGAASALMLGSQPYRRLSGDCMRVLTCVRWVKLGLHHRETASSGATRPTTRSVPPWTLKIAIGMRQNCWQPHGKLLASAMPFRTWSGARQRSMIADLLAVQVT